VVAAGQVGGLVKVLRAVGGDVHQRDIMGGSPGVLQQGFGPDYRWREGARRVGR